MTVSVPTTLALGTIADGSLMIASDERNNFTAIQVGVNGLIAMFTNAPTKGDLVVSAGAGSFDKLGVGSNGQVVTADSTQPLGVKWAASGATFSGCVATISVDQSITTSGTEQAVTWDSEDFDTDAYHSLVSNTSRFTVPTGFAGKYEMVCEINWAASATGTVRDTWLRKNGTTKIGATARIKPDAAANPIPPFHSGVVTLADADYVEVMVKQDSGGALNIGSGVAGAFNCRASFKRLGS